MSRACEKNNRAENYLSGGATARAQDATIQISAIGATLSERAWPPSTIPSPPSAISVSRSTSESPDRRRDAMAQGNHWHDDSPRSGIWLECLNLTVPVRNIFALS